jgi:hypothetical protein
MTDSRSGKEPMVFSAIDRIWNLKKTGKSMALLMLSGSYNIVITMILAALINQSTPFRIVGIAPNGAMENVEFRTSMLFNQQQLMSFARNTILSTYNFNFTNVSTHLKKLRHDFSSSAWDQFQAALKRNNVIASTIKYERAVSSVPVGAPVIVKQHALPNGRYGWMIQMPILVNYSAGSESDSQPVYYNVTLVVVRTKIGIHPKGAEIVQFTVTHLSSIPQGGG